MTQYSIALSNYMQRCHASATPRAALFDMDGTLYDSMPNHVKAWQQMLREAGIEVEPAELLLAEGRTGTDTVRQLFMRHLSQEISDEDCRRLYRRKAELFTSMPPVTLMPGAQKLVKAVRDAGLTTVLVTGSGQGSLLERLEADFPGAFPQNRRVTAYNVSRGKPDPEPYLKGMEMASVLPRQTIAFDNAPLGVQSACNAGALTIGIVTGPIPPQSLVDAGADIVFNSMPQCADAIAEVLNLAM